MPDAVFPYASAGFAPPRRSPRLGSLPAPVNRARARDRSPASIAASPCGTSAARHYFDGATSPCSHRSARARGGRCVPVAAGVSPAAFPVALSTYPRDIALSLHILPAGCRASRSAEKESTARPKAVRCFPEGKEACVLQCLSRMNDPPLNESAVSRGASRGTWPPVRPWTTAISTDPRPDLLPLQEILGTIRGKSSPCDVVFPGRDRRSARQQRAYPHESHVSHPSLKRNGW
jgi:hypothetical protein